MQTITITRRFYSDPGKAVSRSGLSGSSTEGTFTEKRNAVGSGSDSEVSVLIAASNTTDRYAFMNRGHFIFNTESMPDSANILYSSIFYKSADGSPSTNTDFGTSSNSNCYICSYEPASFTIESSADYDVTRYGSVVFGTIDRVEYFDNATAQDFHEVPLNSDAFSEINKGGMTSFGVMSGWDINATNPAWSSFGVIEYSFGFSSKILTDEVQHYLEVTYEVDVETYSTLEVFNTDFEQGRTKIWNGTEWVYSQPKMYDGTDWRDLV